MPCTSPNYILKNLGRSEKVKFITREQYLEYSTHPNPRYNVYQVPCGQCMSCRLEYSRQWAIRCCLEASLYPPDHCWFVTLTYDDDHLFTDGQFYVHDFVDTSTGEFNQYYSTPLCYDDKTSFIKALRQYYHRNFEHDGIRYFGCGEYGDKSMRPHFHICFFNLPIHDLDISKTLKSHSGYPIYESETLSRIWSKGIVAVCELSFASCAYVGRYVTKKHKGRDSDYYVNLGLTPEKSFSSRRPGIGAPYYFLNKDKIYNGDTVTVPAGFGKSLTCKPPRSFDRLFRYDDFGSYLSVKSKRYKTGKIDMYNQLDSTTKSFEDLMHDIDESICKKTTSLLRNDT